MTTASYIMVVLTTTASVCILLLPFITNLRQRVERLEEDLPKRAVEAGFVHRSHVRDPEHFDEHGRYTWWGD